MKNLDHSVSRKYLLALLLCVSASLRYDAQVRPINDYGALGLGHLLKRLNTTASVMMIGAHPDDEDSALLAYLARGEAARTAYLSLTRGDGGQNIIGPELFEPLGIIRTEELLQARRLDGAEQYFTRAYDYGFSKTLAEAKSKWPENVIKCDVVRAIRLFRPMVVISRFTGTPADGHGQHQYAGYITPIAVKAAADPQQCTDAGEPWRVLKFYVEQSFGDTSQPTLRINTGQYDPLLGRTYFEVAMEGRSMHRSQGEGRIEFRGDQFSGLNLIENYVPKTENEASIFAGIETSLPSLPRYEGFPDKFEGRDDLIAAQRAAQDVRRAWRLDDPSAIRPLLITGNRALSAAIQKCIGNAPPPRKPPSAEQSQNEECSFFPLVRSATLFEELIKRTVGLSIDVLADAETVAPGDRLVVTANIFYREGSNVIVKELVLGVPRGWERTPVTGAVTPSPNLRRDVPRQVERFAVTVGKDAAPTQPNWLQNPRLSDMYSLADNESNPVYAFGKIEIDGEEVGFYQPAQFRFADPARGEIRREVNVVPALSVAVDRDLLIVPRSDKAQVKRLVVSVTNNTAKEQPGTVSLNISTSPAWKVTMPNGAAFSLKTKGAKASIPFDIAVPAKTDVGNVPIRASAEVGMNRYSLTMNVVSYPHIQTHRYYTNADSTVEVLDLKTAPVKVGYIMGSGDEVPEAIRQMGMDVTMLEEKDLASGDLSRFDTIVVGIRASETRPDLVANNARLLDYARSGGTVIMQYQRGNWTGLAPYPVNTQDKQGTAAGSIARVVDENAPVKILDPSHPVFNFPNKITEADFIGWVQERNAYNLVTFDPQYSPLLESHDAGEQENKGGLVVAKVGKGNWVYCSYSFFRQLPAGVPGAYRLFANLLSLPKAK